MLVNRRICRRAVGVRTGVFMRSVTEIGITGRSANDLLAPLFGEAWTQRPLDLLSDPIKELASAGMLNPRSLKSSEVQALAAAVMAYIVEKEK